MNLPQVWLRRILRHTGAMLNRDSEMCITDYTLALSKDDAALSVLGEGMACFRMNGDDHREHVV